MANSMQSPNSPAMMQQRILMEMQDLRGKVEVLDNSLGQMLILMEMQSEVLQIISKRLEERIRGVTG